AGGVAEQPPGDTGGDTPNTRRAPKARSRPFNIEMGLGKAVDDDPDYPGRISYVYSEEAARGLYAQWARMMTSENWDALNATRPIAAE
ncbi:MAG: aromatic ring-hydroxylating dioxygenase subunit alpha, partial [Brevundimonas sp.]|nr:aromatic ring-hydroxylating dioxygenase subunit alpha [Brevundimonas sp.]